MKSTLEPGAGGAISRQRLAHLGYGFTAWVQHRARGPLHDSAHRNDHGKPAVLREGYRRSSAFFYDRPFATQGVEGAVPVETSDARIAVLGCFADRKRLIAQQQSLVRTAEQPEAPSSIGTTCPSIIEAILITQALAFSLLTGAVECNCSVEV